MNAQTTNARAYIGISGWNAKGLRSTVLPENTPEKDMLSAYADIFATVEVNNSFYQLPKARDIAGWQEDVPQHFKFCLKMSRYLTHMKKLKDAQDPVRTFMSQANKLNGYKGPLLLQLPPNLGPVPERLENTLEAIKYEGGDQRWKVAVEARRDEWYDTDEVQNVIDRHNATLVLHDMVNGANDTPNPGAGFIYMRFHGPDGDYGGTYSDKALAQSAGRINDYLKDGLSVYAFFNNDRDGYAPANARRMQDLLAQRG